MLFLAGIYGERPRSAKEVVLATQRALEQRALELWRLQTEAKIEGMMRRGEPLGAVAAALASHETAERIAVLEAATSGGLTPVQAARLNVRRAGGDVQLLDDLHAHGASSGATRLSLTLVTPAMGGACRPFRSSAQRPPAQLSPSPRLVVRLLASGETAAHSTHADERVQTRR